MALEGLGGAGYLMATHVGDVPTGEAPTAGGSVHTTPGAENKLNKASRNVKRWLQRT